MGKKLAENDSVDRRFTFFKYICPSGLSSPAPGFIHVYDNYFQTFFSETAWPNKTKFYMEPCWEEGT